LLPFPPGTIVNELPITVSPADGNLAVLAVRSIDRLPTTTTSAMFAPPQVGHPEPDDPEPLCESPISNLVAAPP
jgi:hypothetical protein